MVISPRSERRSRGSIVAILIVVAVLVGAAIVTMGILRVQDPTEDFFAVMLRNDTAALVLLEQCDVRCDSFHESHWLAPGGAVQVNASDGNVASWWLTQDSAGRALGCLRLQFDHKVSGAQVNVSTAAECPR